MKDLRRSFVVEGRKESNSARPNLSKDEFRQYLIKLNSEFNLEEIFDQIEIGIGAFEKLNNYNLDRDLEVLYCDENNAYVKDFIKVGVNFIKSLDTVEELSQFDTNNSLNSMTQASTRMTRQRSSMFLFT